MKNWKHYAVVFLTVIIIFAFISCDDKPKEEPPEQPKDQIATLTNLFSVGYSATVKGHLTDAEWIGVAGKVETALNGAYSDIPEGMAGATIRSTFLRVFGYNNELGYNNVVIIVEKTKVYAKYKVVDGAFRTLYLNFNALDSIQSDLVNAITAMNNEMPTVN